MFSARNVLYGLLLAAIVTTSLALDAHGKSLRYALLEMEIQLP